MRTFTLFLIAALLFFLAVFLQRSNSPVLTEGEKTYIVDRQGERWDISQAVSIGFRPNKFQYGLGRHAFDALDDRYLSDETDTVPADLRIIGVSSGDEARAYSVPALDGHEIANSGIGSKPIAVGY